MITSLQNSVVKLIISLKNATTRKQHQLIVVEHHKSILELLQKSPQRIHTLVVTDEYLEKNPHFSDIPSVRHVTPNVWAKIKTTTQSPGILALVHYPPPQLLAPLLTKARLLVGLNRIQDPKNLGAIIRCAVAFQADGILLFPGCADPYHPDAIRSSVGYSLHIPLCHTTAEDIAKRLSEWHIFGLDPKATQALHHTQAHTKTLLLLGSEGQGLGLDIPYTPLNIPISPTVDSLNVSVAAGIALYQLTQQKRDLPEPNAKK